MASLVGILSGGQVTRPHHNIQNGLTTNSRSYESHSQQALLVRQFVENEPLLARNAFLCYTLYSSILKDRIEEFELPYPRVISTPTFLYYRVAVVDLKGKAGVQRTQSFAGVWGVPSFSTYNPLKDAEFVCCATDIR